MFLVFIQTWTCEFCGTKTTVDLVPEEIPVEADTTYLTAASAAQVGDQAAAAGGSAEESIVVFCIDTSGSMCVTTEVRKSGSKTRITGCLQTDGSPLDRSSVGSCACICCMSVCTSSALIST